MTDTQPSGHQAAHRAAEWSSSRSVHRPNRHSTQLRSIQLRSTKLRSAQLRSTLLVLLPLALAAALKAALLPTWPRVAALNSVEVQQPLEHLGLEAKPLTGEPPWRSEGLALSGLQRYELKPGIQLQLQRVQIQRRDDYQLAYMGRPWTPGRHDLALGPKTQVVRSGAGEHAIAERPTTVVRQTCLIGPGSGVTATQLGTLADQLSSGPGAIAARLLGLQPNRSWQCLMVSLHSTRSQPTEHAAAALWPQLQKALKPLAAHHMANGEW